jgi:hypothetical protein
VVRSVGSQNNLQDKNWVKPKPTLSPADLAGGEQSDTQIRSIRVAGLKNS